MFSEIKLIENLLTASAHRLRTIKLALKASEMDTALHLLPKRIRLRKKEEEREYQFLIQDLNEVLAETLGENLVFFRNLELYKGFSTQFLNLPQFEDLKVSKSLSLLAQGRAVISNN